MHDHPVMGYKMTELQGNEDTFPERTTTKDSYPDYDVHNKNRKKKLIPYNPSAQRSLNDIYWRGDKNINPEPKKYIRYCRESPVCQAGYVTGQGGRENVKQTCHKIAHKVSHIDPGRNSSPTAAAKNTREARARLFGPN